MLQEGIDAVAGIDEPAKMDSGGIPALNKLRIGSLLTPDCTTFKAGAVPESLTTNRR